MIKLKTSKDFTFQMNLSLNRHIAVTYLSYYQLKMQITQNRYKTKIKVEYLKFA